MAALIGVLARPSSMPPATAISHSSAAHRRATAITVRSISAPSGTRSAGLAADADLPADALRRAVQAARARGIGPITKDRSVVARLPGSGDIVCYLASAEYDPRDGASLTRAEMSGREQAW